MKKTILLGFVCAFCLFSCTEPYRKTDTGVRATVGDVQIELHFYSPTMVRVIKSPVGTVCAKKSFSVVAQPKSIPLGYMMKGDVLQVETDSLSVLIDLSAGHIAFAASDKSSLLKEKEHSALFSPVTYKDGDSFRIEQVFLLDEQEPIYGLGQQQEGIMNYRGKSVNLQQMNTLIAIPFFQSVKGYGVFWDNTSVTQFTDDANGTSFSSEVGDCIDYYFMYGGNMDGTIACMRDLTGQAPMFPLWTWGYWQSKERYASQEETVGVVRRYRELKIPLDGIIQDWRYWSDDNAYWNGIEFRNPEFPDPQKMMTDIHRLNAHSIISVWPSFGIKTEPYKLFKEKGMLFDFESFPQPDSVRVYDAFDSEARAIYWKLMDRYIFSKGFDGWWLDATEPEYSNLSEAQLDQPTAAGSFRKVRNAYPIASVGGVYDHQRAETDAKRVYILTRSAFAGQQRYGANSWSGDTEAEWETLRKQIPAGLNFSLCGIPYWNSDIGGFWVRGTSSQDGSYKELYVRWLQFGAFTPMMRSHGTSTPREIWQFGRKGDRFYDAIEKYIRLRYSLLPYHYSLSWEVTSHSGSIMRMLAMDFPHDENVYDMGSQFMYGKSFLVVPVTEKGARYYPVYLPGGACWYDFWTNEKIEGGKTIDRETPLNIMPLYVRAGSIVPFGPEVQYATEKSWEELAIRVYPGADATFTLYEDEFDNYNYEKGLCSTIEIKWDNKERILTIGERTGSYRGMLEKRTFFVSIAGECGEREIAYEGKEAGISFE